MKEKYITMEKMLASNSVLGASIGFLAPAAVVKTCGCGQHFTHSQWNSLDYVGRQGSTEIEEETPSCTYFNLLLVELRNCPCNTTLVMELH